MNKRYEFKWRITSSDEYLSVFYETAETAYKAYKDTLKSCPDSVWIGPVSLVKGNSDTLITVPDYQ